jgi:hypothetical protein
MPQRRADAGRTGETLLRRAGVSLARTGDGPSIRETQLLVPGDDPLAPELRSFQIQPPAGDVRRVRIFPRSAVPFNVETHVSERTTPPEQVWVITGGVNVVIDGLDVPEPLLLDGAEAGRIGLAADRMVIWTQTGTIEQFQTETVQARDVPFTVYMEGNIVIRQGPHVLRASHAVYDAREDRGLMLNAELRAFVPSLGGDIRVAAERVRQLSQRSFHAENAWTSTSQFGRPGYRVQASDVFFEYRPVDPWFRPGVAIDPLTGAPVVEETPWITSLNNTLFLGDVPVFYVPRISAPADRSRIPLRRANGGQDRIFGAQLRTVWDMSQLLGIDAPDGVQWDLLADYMTMRGPAIGTGGLYAGTDLFGLPGPFSGNGIAYYVHDSGRDNLGADRRDLIPPDRNRGRVLLRHRQEAPDNLLLQGEIGFLSDRNFLEQYFLPEFHHGKDNETMAYARQLQDNMAWTLLGRVQLNDFENRTEWLPRGDLYLLSEPLLGGWLTWSTRTSAAYARLNPAAPPTDPREVFVPLPYVADVEGMVAMSRHELNAPLDLGPLHVTPFVLGEAAFWSEDFTGNSIDRFVGSAGVRSSLSFWGVFPNVQSGIFNLNGLAHKVRLEAEYALTGASRGLDQIPQYHEIDDDAQERFRQRLPINTFGGVVPPQFDPRFYAVRRGTGLMVTAPYHELVDDQQVLRLAARQRLQTKVGPPDRPRIRDWMLLDLEASVFPNAERDNFGETFGLLGARYSWLFSERTRLVADALYDLFEDAPQLWSLGIITQRAERGSIYVGVRQVKGAGLDSRILTASYSYNMGPKWVSTLGTAYDIGEGQNRGQSLTITRVGADFLIHFGTQFNPSTNNAGLALSVEPRFAPFGGPTQLGNLMGAGR